ncbi:MAG: DEAD/DEAH box helicase family protein [Chloroflexota bacterium]
MTTQEQTADLAARFAATAFRHPFRRYQALALDAFETARAAGRRRAYLVLPPGAGKTALGLEIARRLGRRTLVLCPNTAVQSQWLRQWGDFQPATVAAEGETALEAPVNALTYQALCNLDGDDEDLAERARGLWTEALGAEEGLAPADAAGSLEALRAANPRAYTEQLSGFKRRARALVAHGGKREELLALLHPNGRELVARLAATGPWTLILDECHHLLAMWGYLVEALVGELGPESFAVGLTATPPADMDPREAALYAGLFGQADFQVPTPAVVKEGDLAPYQELAYLTRPLAHEAAFIDAQQERFAELTDKLLAGEIGSTPFSAWLQRRVDERATAQGAQLSWTEFERAQPALAQAALRLYHHYGWRLPAGARLAERHRAAPTSDDWVELIDDYCRRCLLPSSAPEDHAAWQQVRRALLSLGYVLTRQGTRAYVSPVDRVLALSASKGVAALEILAVEREALGERLRALVLCDYEKAGSDVLAKLRGVLDPQAGSAALLLHTLLFDRQTAALNPVLVTGRTVACSRATAATLLPWLEREAPQLQGVLALEALFSGEQKGWEDVVVVRPSHPWWRPRHYVPLLTRYFEAGHSQCLVGTRGLLGEGWDARGVNVLVDLTAASTSTTVHQMRGRSIRLDPTLPRKVANNWDVVCLAPQHPKGLSDYARFVRKHRRYYAPTTTGEIESGVSHVHAELSPYGPPPAEQLGAINESQLARARERETAYERWAVGQPYENRETHTIRLHAERQLGLPGKNRNRHLSGIGPLRRTASGLVLGVLSAGLLGVTFESTQLATVLAALVVVASVLGLGASVRRTLDGLDPSDLLADMGQALLAALRETGAVATPAGETAVRADVEPDGHYRCYLAGATDQESRLFAEALDELLSPLAAPRYLISRHVSEQPTSALGALWTGLRDALPGRPGTAVVYHAVPEYLGANKERAQAFARAWREHVGTGQLLYYQQPEAQAILGLMNGANPFEVTSQLRVRWE